MVCLLLLGKGKDLVADGLWRIQPGFQFYHWQARSHPKEVLWAFVECGLAYPFSRVSEMASPSDTVFQYWGGVGGTLMSVLLKSLRFSGVL